MNPLDALIAAVGGVPGEPPLGTADVSLHALRARVVELEQTNERLKAKARELIDIAYNRALADMATELGNGAEALSARVKLLRAVRR